MFDLWHKPIVLVALFDKLGMRSGVAHSQADVDAFVQKYNDQRNIYFHVNELTPGFDGKATKEDVVRAHWLHVDLDPRPDHDLDAERSLALKQLTTDLPKNVPPPTVIVFSGGGYQAYWKLAEPFNIDNNARKAEEWFEPYGAYLEKLFIGADNCRNVDRLMRVPGSQNWPNAKKRAAGREPTKAQIMDMDPSRVYDLGQFRKDRGTQVGSTGNVVRIPSNIERVTDLDALDEWNVPSRVKAIIAEGRPTTERKEGDNSRSAWLFDALCNLYRCDVPEDTIYAIITDPDWPISESVREKKNYQKYAAREMARAKEYAEDKDLAQMNERFAVIGNMGGKCRVIEEVHDETMGRSRMTVSTFEELRNRFSNKWVDTGSKPKTLGRYWLDHPKRRQYDYLKFLPGGEQANTYNMWRGFNVDPEPQASCDIYLSHLRDIVCSDQEQYDYLIRWMAHAVQMPHVIPEVAIVLQGGKGVGKSIVAQTFGHLFGRHYLEVSQASHLVGNFNSHLMDTIVLFADEATFAGDPRQQGVLKHLITSTALPIEKKGLDVESHKSYLHIIMASNSTHVVDASGDERRYLVLNVSDTKSQNKAYFGAMVKQMKEGGYGALLYHLQNIDLSDFEVRSVPKTKALARQKLLSLSPDEEWWLHKLRNEDESWRDSVPVEALSNSYVNYMRKWHVDRRGNETRLREFLKSICPDLKSCSKIAEVPDERGMMHTRRTAFFELGSLEDCRKQWNKAHGEYDW